MPSTDRKLELQAKDIDVSTVSQPAVCSNRLRQTMQAALVTMKLCPRPARFYKKT